MVGHCLVEVYEGSGPGIQKKELYQAQFVFGDFVGGEMVVGAHIKPNNYLCLPMQKICYVSHEIDFRRLQEQAKDCLDPAKVLLELLNVENSNEELGRELELKLAFPAFQLSGYLVNK